MGLLHGGLKHEMERLQQTKRQSMANKAGRNEFQEENISNRTKTEMYESDEDKPEKRQALAMFLAALIVTLPVLLLAAGLMLLAFWLFV